MIKLAAAFPPSLWENINKNPDGSVAIRSIDDFAQILANVIHILLSLGAAIAVIFIIRAGMQMVMSSGDPAKVASARGAIVNAIFGLILSAGAYLVVSFIAGRF